MDERTQTMTREPVEIRLVRREDLDTLHRNCLSGWPLEALREEIEQNLARAAAGERFHFVAVAREGELRGEVVGTAYLEREAHPLQRHSARLVGVSVTGPYRRQGVARRLNEAVRARAAELGVAQLLTSCRGGDVAETVWKRTGYVEYGRLAGGFLQPGGERFDQVLLEQPVTEEVVFSPAPEGRTRVDLLGGGRSLARVEIDPLTLRYGVATLRAACIGDVYTEEPWRNRGYARRLLTAALERSRDEGADLALLYGIGDFYHRFGFATVGADFNVELRNPQRGAALPAGWRVREATAADVPAIRRLYDLATRDAIGARVRPESGLPWSRLDALVRRPEELRGAGDGQEVVQEGVQGAGDSQEGGGSQGVGERRRDACRVLVGPDEEVGAYAWRGLGFWTVDHAQERYWPDDLALGEVLATGPAGADAALAACRLWAQEEEAQRGRRVHTVRLGTVPDGAVAAAAQHQDGALTRTSWFSAGPQARTLDAGRLLAAIEPELSRRVATLRSPWQGAATIVTEAGGATITAGPHGVRVKVPGGGEEGPRLELPQTTLMRLVLGAFPPDDLLARDDSRRITEGQGPAGRGVLSGDERRECLATLFPQRRPHLHQLDR